MNRYWVNFIALLAVLGVVYLVFNFRNSTYFLRLKHKLAVSVEDKISTVAHNINTEFIRKRKPPLTFIDKEQKLAQFIPFVFGKFTKKDWENFWDACYNPQGKGFFSKKRYLTREEIKDYLMEYFPDLSYLQDIHWKYLWEIVYGQGD